jgi:hypothetical protein
LGSLRLMTWARGWTIGTKCKMVRLWDARGKGAKPVAFEGPLFEPFYLLLQVCYPTQRFRGDTNYTTRAESGKSETLIAMT